MIRVAIASVLALMVSATAWAGNWNAGSAGGVTVLKSNSGELKSISHKHKYGLQANTEVVRYGEKSQRFEIRHGDCNGDSDWDDCKNDRRRIERTFDLKANKVINKILWFGYSIYLPSNFEDVAPSNAGLGQVKLVGYRQPIWDLQANWTNLRFIANASQQKCNIKKLAEARGRWVDVAIGFDFSTKGKVGQGAFSGDFAEVWVDGKKANCAFPQPVLTQKMINSRSKQKGDFHFDWGIYNSYVSRWLDKNKTKTPDVKAFADKHNDSGLVVKSATKEPWSVDWGVKFPTQVVYFDEIRIGSKQEDVDIRIIEAKKGKAAD
jgi:hypothetical protein